ncbi:putative RNA-binding protein 19, partial [Trichinella pseudospiralis]
LVMHNDDTEKKEHPVEETTSRLIVKNLPKNFKETHLRALFEEYGTLTDCQLRFNEENNNFRGFGFVGYQNADNAKAAKNALDNTFVKSSRIKVEYCHPLCSNVTRNDKRVQSKNKNVASGKTIIRIRCQFPLKRKHLLVFLSPIKPCKIILVDDGLTALVHLQRKGDATAIIKRNGSYICGNKIEITPHEESASTQDLQHSNLHKRRQYPAENPKQQADLIAESGCIFLRNLPYQCTEEDLKNWLKTFGPIAEVNFHVDSKTGKPKGFALVKFVFPENALKVFTECDGSIFQGRVIHILAGLENEDENNNAKGENDDDDTVAFKDAKERKQQQAACDKRTWNSLFLGVNAVADIMAETLDVEKGAILNVHSHSSLGVRMALGESRIVRETREFLEQNGVQLESFSGNLTTKRSNNVMLVKNLPAKTATADIRHLFGKFGRLGRVLLPPSGLTAIVEFLLDSDAKTAFQNLAFKRFGKTALFLEWAPDDVFNTKFDSAKVEGEDEKQEANRANESQQQQQQQQASNNNRLFVKNLSPDTSDEDLAEFFKKIGPVLSATVAKKYCKPTAGKAMQCISLRYGFVEYENDQHAQEAIRRLQNSELKGAIIQIQLSKRQVNNFNVEQQNSWSIGQSNEKTKPRSQTKIIVRNIPFQASVQEITKLFKVFGNVHSVRLPKKTPNGQHRGFGFVEFNCKADAEKAFKHLGVSTHLYGRRLVLEWADLEDDLQELRDKTAEYFTLGSRRKKVKFEIE